MTHTSVKRELNQAGLMHPTHLGIPGAPSPAVCWAGVCHLVLSAPLPTGPLRTPDGTFLTAWSVLTWGSALHRLRPLPFEAHDYATSRPRTQTSVPGSQPWACPSSGFAGPSLSPRLGPPSRLRLTMVLWERSPGS